MVSRHNAVIHDQNWLVVLRTLKNSSHWAIGNQHCEDFFNSPGTYCATDYPLVNVYTTMENHHV